MKSADTRPALDISSRCVAGLAEPASTAAAAETTAAAASMTAGATLTWRRTGLGREQAFALHLLARELAGAADRFRLFPCFLFGGFLVVAAELHLAENALTLHLV